MKSVLCRIPCPWDATALYRSTGPFNHLRTIANIQFKTSENYNWVVIGSHDCIFMQRPFTDQDLQLAHLTKRCNKPLILDYDDDLFSVPEHNPAFKFYGSEKIHKNIRMMVAMADQVMVSTELLGEKLNTFRENKAECVVVPNALPHHMLDMKQEKVPRDKVITWRGSNTHEFDLATVHESISHVVNKFPDWKWVFLGEPDYRTLSLVPKNMRTVVPSQDPIDFLNIFKSAKSTVHIVPLEHTQFNLAKSNIAWIEATYAGAATIAPKFGEWLLPGIINYDSPDSFTHQLTSVLEDPKKAEEPLSISLGSIPLVGTTNKLRKAVFQSVMGDQW